MNHPDPFGEVVNPSFEQPTKQSMELLWMDNFELYNMVQVEQFKKNIQKEAAKPRGAQEKGDGGNEGKKAGGEVGVKNKEESEIKDEFDFLVDPVTGKNMKKKRIQELYAQGLLTQHIVSELDKRNLLQSTLNLHSEGLRLLKLA